MTQNNPDPLITQLTSSLQAELRAKLIGLYLTGSLTYGDFDPESSDIDFLVVLEDELSSLEYTRILSMHAQLSQQFPTWQKRLEGSYITKAMLLSEGKPAQARPYYNAGVLNSFPYGEEWTIDMYMLQESGLTLYGPPPKSLMRQVAIENVREATHNYLLQDWKPKIQQAQPFSSELYDSSHLQAYAILTMGRILYTLANSQVASKVQAANWASQTYPQWKKLFATALTWKHGMQIDQTEQIQKLIGFVVKEASSSVPRNAHP